MELDFKVIPKEKLLSNFPKIHNQINKYYGFDDDTKIMFSDFPELNYLIQKSIVNNENLVKWIYNQIKKRTQPVRNHWYYARFFTKFIRYI